MKEKDPVELTTKEYNFTLEVRRDIFMPEPGRGEFQSQPSELTKKEVAQEKLEASKSAWDKLNEGRTVSIDERRTQQMLIERGIMPMVGGSGEDESIDLGYPEQGEEGALPIRPHEMELNVDAILGANEELRKEFNELTESQKRFVERYSKLGFLASRGGEEVVIEQKIAQGIVVAKNPETMREASKILDKMEGKVSVAEMIRDTQNELNSSTDGVQKAEDISQVRKPLNDFLQFARLVEEFVPSNARAEFLEKVDNIEKLKDEGNLEQLKKEVEELSPKVRTYYANVDQRVPETPESLEDLITLIMRSESSQWRIGGDNALMDSEGRISKENFMAWVRKRMIEIHEFNPSSTVDFFSGISVKTRFSSVSFYEMVLTGSYFLEKRREEVIVGKDINGNPQTTELTRFHKNDDYEKLKTDLIYEAFLFQNSRNNHVNYIAQMHDEKKLPEVINGMYYANPFTRQRFLEQILTLPSTDKDKINEVRKASGLSDEEFEKKKIETILEKQSDVGEGVRRALLAYYYINDFDMLKQVLGRDSVFFKEEYYEYDTETGKIKRESDGTLKVRKGEANQELHIVNYKNGNINENDRFTKYVNVFNDAQKDERIVREVRERLTQTLVEKFHISYSEAKYAESWAYSMTRWTGIGARNDVYAVGYDAWSKTQNLMEYRLKQIDPKRRGVVGNLYNLLGVKRASLSFFEGITDVHGRTVIEAIQDGQGTDFKENNPFRKGKETKHLEFKQDIAQRFAGNHIGNSFRIYDFLINHAEFDIESMVTRDSVGRIVVDQKKANEMIDGIQKGIRYAYCTWAGTDYSKNIRVWERVGKDKHEAETLPVAAALFGPQILKFIKEDIDRREAEARKKHLETPLRTKGPNVWTVGEGKDRFTLDFAKIEGRNEKDQMPEREILWQHILKYLIAEEIKSHRTIGSELKRFDFATTEKIYAFLRQKGIVTDQDIKDMRRLSKTNVKRMFSEELALAMGAGGGVGFWKALKIFYKDVTKDVVIGK